ncbi:MAG: hypothetical protein HUU19_05090 [Phycisphaerales bacterium]|nr:hypothetical protein [Phycisphaerales bacterium]
METIRFRPTRFPLLMVAMAAAPALAQPLYIDFELLPGMTNQPGATIPVQSRLGDQYLATHGVRFSSGSPFIAVVVHGPGTPSGLNVIGGSTSAGTLTYDPANPIDARFFDHSGEQPRVVSVVSVVGDLFSIPGTKTLEAYDISGIMIASDTRNDNYALPLVVSVPGIHRVRMYSSSATVGFDDLRFDDPQPPCPADFNADGFVNGDDYDLFASYFEIGDIRADFNADGFVNGDDYDSFASAFEAGC